MTDNEIFSNIFLVLMLALVISLSGLFHHVFESSISKKYSSYFDWTFGRKLGADKDSNLRRYFTIAIFFYSYAFVVVALAQVVFPHEIEPKKENSYLGVLMCLIPIGYFIYVVLLTPFRTSSDFKVNPVRLAHNTMVSAFAMISFFAVFYSVDGISRNGTDCEYPVQIFETMYFSTVTFSTLGYGDLSPCSGIGRFMASLLAIIGNTHLGVFVAAVFLSVNQNNP